MYQGGTSSIAYNNSEVVNGSSSGDLFPPCSSFSGLELITEMIHDFKCSQKELCRDYAYIHL